MNLDFLQFIAVAVITGVIVYALITAEARLSIIEDSLNELAGVMGAKNSLARSNEQLAETVKDLATKNERLHEMLKVKRNGVQSEAPSIISDKFPNVGKE